MIALLLVACAAAPVFEEAALAATPFASIDRDVDRTPFAGRVTELRDAGGYQYAQVDGRWVVGLAKGLAVGDPVQVRPVGMARDFHSGRTGHDYGELWFGVLDPTETNPRRGHGNAKP